MGSPWVPDALWRAPEGAATGSATTCLARVAEAAGRLTVSRAELALSFVHMHANRLFRSEHRLQELVLYSLLARHYEAQLLRRPGRP